MGRSFLRSPLGAQEEYWGQGKDQREGPSVQMFRRWPAATGDPDNSLLSFLHGAEAIHQCVGVGTVYSCPQGLAQMHYSAGRAETRPMSLKSLWSQEPVTPAVCLVYCRHRGLLL